MHLSNVVLEGFSLSDCTRTDCVHAAKPEGKQASPPDGGIRTQYGKPGKKIQTESK